MILQHYSDPGHGWVKVKRNLLTKLGIAEHVSTCSYVNGDNVFLEEDCDASLLVEALKTKGIPFKIKSNPSNRQSRIRNYYSYRYEYGKEI